MGLPEKLLFQMAKLLYKTNVSLTPDMKEALQSAEGYSHHRSEKAAFVLQHAKRIGFDIRGKVVLDFGCGDGAISHHYLEAGAERVIGVDVSVKDVGRARELFARRNIEF